MSKLDLSSLLRIEITDEPVIPGRSGMNERGAYTIPSKQPAYLWQSDRYPTRIELPLGDKPPFRPGIYLLAGKPTAARVVNARPAIVFDLGGLDLVPVSALTETSPSKAA